MTEPKQAKIDTMPTSIRSSEEPPQQEDFNPFMDIYNQLHTINSDESRAHNVNKKLGDTNEKPASQTRKHHGNSRPRKPRKLKLEDDEEEIIKMQERLEFQKVLDNQIKAIDPELIQPLPECMNKYKIECPDDSCASSMLILLQYQSFKSFVDYSEDEEKQNEQVQAQKQDRFLLMKKKRAIRREKRKSFKMKRSLASTNRIMQQPMIIGPVLFLSPNMASNAYSNEIMQPSFTGPMMNPMNPMMSTCMSTTDSDCTNYSEEDSLGEEEWSNDFDDDQENEEEDPSRMQYEQRGYEPEYKRFKYSAPDEVQCSYGSVSQSGPASTASSSSVSSRNFDTLFDNMVQQPCCVPQANLPPSHRQASVLTVHSVSSEQEYTTMSNLVPSCDTIATPMRCGESPFIPSNTILQPPPQIWYQSPAMIPTDDYRLAPNAAVRQPTNLGVCSVNNFNIYPQ